MSKRLPSVDFSITLIDFFFVWDPPGTKPNFLVNVLIAIDYVRFEGNYVRDPLS